MEIVWYVGTLGTAMSVDFDDRTREIRDIAAISEFTDNRIGARSFWNHSIEWNIG